MSIELLSQVKATVRNYEDAQGADMATFHAARTQSLELRTRISDEMSSLLRSKEFEDRGDLLAKYRQLRKLHEMLAV